MSSYGATHLRKLPQAKERLTFKKSVGEETYVYIHVHVGVCTFTQVYVHMYEQACGSRKPTLDESTTLHLIILDRVSQ